MLRKLIFAVCAVALTLASCGRQVTPNRTNTPNGLQPGQMQVKFLTQAPPDFVNNWYVLAFNTSGNGVEPYAINGNQLNNWLNFSFEIVVFQPNANSAIQAVLIQFVSTQGPNGPLKTPVQVCCPPPQDLIVIPNCGTQNQFCVTLSRNIFITQYCSPSPSSSPSSSPAPSATPSATPSPSSSCVANTWNVNWFVASPNGNPTGQVISAAGSYGVTDTTFQKTYNVTTTFDQTWTQPLPPAVPQAPSQAAQIAGGEVANEP
ncbi:MAG TPA: hypothetical protein VFE17_10835 [Candidatus Baltobacteraceae bacterium]|jgi:hypothetical protein|nr:hypothetical protein [Candidatus Baltobacteraceae bacterium]